MTCGHTMFWFMRVVDGMNVKCPRGEASKRVCCTCGASTRTGGKDRR